MDEAVGNRAVAFRVAHMPALRLAGLLRRYAASPDAMHLLGEQWREFSHGPGGRIMDAGATLYGVHRGLFDTREDEYFSGVEIGSADEIPPPLTELLLPSHVTCAVIEHTGPVQDISQTTSKFLREAGCRLPKERSFDLIERYGKNFDPQAARGDIQLIIPVEA